MLIKESFRCAQKSKLNNLYSNRATDAFYPWECFYMKYIHVGEYEIVGIMQDCRVLNCIYSIYKHLAGNTSGKFKVLGIHFNLYKEDKVF